MTAASKYRGAVVEVRHPLPSPPSPIPSSYHPTLLSMTSVTHLQDLQLPPAFALPYQESISRAIELAYERDFSHIPVLDKNRRPLGYVDVARLKEKWEAGQADPSSKVLQYMTKFKRTPAEPYTLVTPLSPLEDLEAFLRDNIFALEYHTHHHQPQLTNENTEYFCAVVTDNDRKFVLAVATAADLETFVKRRGL
ncbi:hypothetical protein PTI98_000173 [Pleurotus ostreatus]|nr:hypothetical protein PTI98_000173 [Pleurotus ostreatus]